MVVLFSIKHVKILFDSINNACLLKFCSCSLYHELKKLCLCKLERRSFIEIHSDMFSTDKFENPYDLIFRFYLIL